VEERELFIKKLNIKEAYSQRAGLVRMVSGTLLWKREMGSKWWREEMEMEEMEMSKWGQKWQKCGNAEMEMRKW